jgi:succinyl-coA synthetase, alpha subunit
MTPQLFTGKNVIIQGITGKNGRFHAQNMLNYKTHIVAGTSPNQSSSEVHGVPVFRTISDIKKRFAIDISVIFVPAPYAKAAILEAIQAQIPLIICITEGVPVHDMLEIKQKLRHRRSVLIGPNCPGVLLPGRQLLGIIPASLAAPGDTAIVSRSGTLTYEVMSLLTRAGFGQRYIIGIGGDMISGNSFVDCLQLFQNDPSVKRIVMIGEIGGISEIAAADYIKQSISKPVYSYIAGHSAPNGVQMGHAGAILGTNALESAAAKTAYLQQAGAITANSISQLVQKIK